MSCDQQGLRRRELIQETEFRAFHGFVEETGAGDDSQKTCMSTASLASNAGKSRKVERVSSE